MKQALSINQPTIGIQLKEWRNKLQFVLDESRYFKNKLDRYSSLALEKNVLKSVLGLREQLFHFIIAVEKCITRINGGLNNDRLCLTEESGCVQQIITYFENIKLQVKSFLVHTGVA